MIESIASHYSWRGLASLAAILAGGIYAILHRNVLEVTPDGWAYWQGAVSMLEGKGYRYFSGADLSDWPPLYSLYLAGWIELFGPTGLCLIAANGTLIAVQAAGWIILAQSLKSPAEPSRSAGGAFLAAVFVAMFVPLWEGPALAHNLLYTILPFQAASALLLCQSRKNALAKLVSLTAGSALLTVVHNSGVVFVLAASLYVFLFAHRGFVIRVLFSVIVTGTSLAVWKAVRVLFDQDDSHPFAAGRFSAFEYVRQAVAGAGTLILPPPFEAVAALGIALVAGWLFLIMKDWKSARWFPIVFTAAPLILLIAIFNVTWIYDPLADARFMLFVPLAILPLAMMAAKSRIVLAVLALFTLPMLAYRLGAEAFAISQTPDFPNAVGPKFVLSREPEPGRLIPKDGGIILAGPPRYESETEDEKPQDEEKTDMSDKSPGAATVPHPISIPR